MTKAPGAYICITCGVTTTAKGHLCNPVKLESRTACKNHEKPKGNPGQMCKRITKKIKYVCLSCGRASPIPDFLCYPQPTKRDVNKPAKARARRR